MKCKSCMVICSLVMWTGKFQDDDTKGSPVVKPISITVLFFVFVQPFCCSMLKAHIHKSMIIQTHETIFFYLALLAIVLFTG